MEPISPEARSEFADIISNFAQDVPNSHIKFSTIGKIIPIRFLLDLNKRDFCFETSCVTIVSRKCGHPGCQYPTVFAVFVPLVTGGIMPEAVKAFNRRAST